MLGVSFHNTYNAKDIRQDGAAARVIPYLNTSTSTVQKWEQGKKHPNGPSLKLLNLADRKGLDVLA